VTVFEHLHSQIMYFITAHVSHIGKARCFTGVSLKTTDQKLMYNMCCGEPWK